jgi:protein ImuB
MDHLACLTLPALPLQLLLRRNRDWCAHPAVVIDRDKPQGLILWVNAHAYRLRILPGMRYAQGLALCRELRAGIVGAAEIVQAVTELAARLRFYTADVEAAEVATRDVGGFWLGASGLSLLHPSLERWARLIHDDLTREGWLCSVVVGFSRFGTYALARATPCATPRATPRAGGGRDSSGWHPGVLVLESAQQEAALARGIPLDRLGFEPQLRDALLQLGISTLGGFLNLPVDGVLERFGPQAHRLQQLARGEMWAPLQPQPAEEPIEAKAHLDHPEADLERLMRVIEELLRQLVAELGRRRQLVAMLALRLGLEDAPRGAGRAAERPAGPAAPGTATSTIEHHLHPARPTRDLRQMLELIRLRLEALQLNGGLGSGVARIELQLAGAAPDRDQLELFPQSPQRDRAAAGRAFARLRAMFGDGAIARAQLTDGHLPEARFGWEVWEGGSGDPVRTGQSGAPVSALPDAKPRVVLNRPLIRRLLQRPLALSRQQRNEPDGWMILGLEGGPVQEAIGPFVVTGGWWVREIHREYHYVRTEKTGWLWVYFDRRRRRWFAQGAVT